MRWINVTCNASKHIIPAQKYLFDKYVNLEPEYIDMGDKPLSDWCQNVLIGLEHVWESEIIWGLDDYLPTGKCDLFKLYPVHTSLFRDDIEWDRLAIGRGCSRTKNTIDRGDYVEYTDESPYRVSCQFSLWQTDSLRKVLHQVNGTPWQFEKKGICKTFALKDPAFRWIEESALSGRWPGKVNVNGLPREDVDTLVKLRYIKREDLINLSE